MTQIGSAAGEGRGRFGSDAILRLKGRTLAAARNRNRYRRGSTLRNGQVLPLTTVVLPRKFWFQYGGMSVSGMNGPGTLVLLVGKEIDPLSLNDLSCRTRRIS